MVKRYSLNHDLTKVGPLFWKAAGCGFIYPNIISTDNSEPFASDLIQTSLCKEMLADQANHKLMIKPLHP